MTEAIPAWDIATFERLVKVLRTKGVAHTIHAHLVTRTLEEAERNAPFLVERLVKTVGFRTRGGELLLAAVPAQKRVEYPRLAALVRLNRRDLTPLSPDEVRERLGVEPGSVSPLLSSDRIKLFIDEKVLQLNPTIYCGIGRADRTLEIAPADLAKITNAHVAPFSR